ncbi:fungal hydrophobin [Agrocybe pediades]|nr:fungal hydrophobin [Agrocybe pediades]
MKFTSAAIVLAAVAAPILAAATPIEARDDGDCNTGSTLYCNTTQQSSTTAISQLAGLLGITLSALPVLVGVNCSPLNILGVGGNSCSAQPVCCSQNNFNGLLAIGCNPININV